MVHIDEPDAPAARPCGRVLGTEDATPLEFWVAVAEGSVPPARRRRGPGAGPAGAASSCASTAWSRRCGPGTRGRASTATSSSSRRASSRPRSASPRRSSPPASSPRCSCRRSRAPRCGGPIGAERDRGAVLRRDGAAAAGRPVARRRAALPEPRLPRRHPRRPRQHQRDLGRRHQDQLRDVPALLPLPVGRAGAGGRQHQGPGLQRQGRGPALPRPRPTSGWTTAGGPLRAASACPSARSRAWPSSPRPGAARRRRCPTSPAATPASRRSSGRWSSSAGTSCCRSCSPTPRTTASSTRWSSTTSPPGCREAAPAGDGAVQHRGRGRAHVPRAGRPGRRPGSMDEDGRPDPRWAGPAIGAGTVNAFIRRLYGAVPHVQHLIRADVPDPERHRVALERQVTVVDLHNLNDRAKRFVVGVVLRKAFDGQGAGRAGPAAAVRGARRAQQVRPARRLQPDQGDPARRGRAGPVARHHPHRRAADGERGRAPHRGQLGHPGRRPPRRRRGRPGRVRLPARACSGTGPRSSSRARCWWPSPSCRSRWSSSSRSRPGPPGPARPARPPATADGTTAGDPADPFEGLPVKFLHTGDWHVGKAHAGAQPGRRAPGRAGRDRGDGRRPSRSTPCWSPATCSTPRRPSAESEQIVYRALLGLARTGAHVVVVAGNHDNDRRLQAVAPLLELGRVTVAASFRRPDDGGVVEVPSRDGARAGAGGAAAVPLAAVGRPGGRADGDRRRPAGPGLRRAHAPPRPGADRRLPAPTR